MSRSWLRYLWASPATALGLAATVLALPRAHISVVDGVLEVHGPVLRRALSHLVPIPGGAAAMALGHVVIGRDAACLERTRAHERVHVRQCERWGPLFVPAYLLASLWAIGCGGDGYADNPFEREARACDREARPGRVPSPSGSRACRRRESLTHPN